MSVLRERIADRLRQLITTPALERGGRQARVLAVTASKGGVGKTTSAVNLAAAWARQHGLRVLLVDLDAQAHVACALSGVSWPSAETLSEVLLAKGRELGELAQPHPAVPGLWLTPSDKNLGETETVLGAKVGKEFILEAALRLTRTHYDLIVLDCPPNLGTLTLNAMVAADELLVPCDMSALALEGVSDLLATVALIGERLNRAPHVLGVLITRWDRRTTRVNDDVLHNLGAAYDQLLLDVRIPLSSMLNRAHLAGRDIFALAPSSPGAQAYGTLAAQLLARLGLQRAARARPLVAAASRPRARAGANA